MLEGMDEMAMTYVLHLYTLAYKRMGCWGADDEQARGAILEASFRLQEVGLDYHYED